MNMVLELGVLFFSALLAATIFPAQSEFVLAALQASGGHNMWVLVIVATTGNVLGSLINWVLGRYIVQFQDKKWFPVKEKQLAHATELYQKYGVWTLLLAWTPFIGDPLTFVAGILRTNIWLFLLLVTIGKAARYIFIVLLI